MLLSLNLNPLNKRKHSDECTNMYYDIEPMNAVGESLDLRTCFKFTATGAVSVVLYF